MTEKIYKLLKDSPAMRWTALVLLASAMFFAYMFVDILSPLQAMLQETKGWDPAAYGTYQGSETFLNVFVFFLIFAGIILDKIGVRNTALLSGALMVIGTGPYPRVSPEGLPMNISKISGISSLSMKACLLRLKWLL